MTEIEFQATLEKDGTITLPENIGKELRPGRVRVKLIDAERKLFDRGDARPRTRSGLGLYRLSFKKSDQNGQERAVI
ncbi:MAG: hypothetical protein ACRD6X_21200 [Pyrinomonadaceae bacterium]